MPRDKHVIVWSNFIGWGGMSGQKGIGHEIEAANRLCF